MLEVIKFKYDLIVQHQTQSILSACIFYQLNQMINYNAQFKDLINKPRCLSHLGKNGICVSHQEFSKYFCVDRKRIEYAMNPLKDLGFIGMDYVNTEMGRYAFYWIEKNGISLIDLDKRQERSCHKSVVVQTKCFNCASLYSHVFYWNDRAKGPLIQSMQLIGDCIGLTKEKVKLSIRKLNDFNIIHMVPSTDNRYSLCIVGIDLLKVKKAPPHEIGENPRKGLLKSDPLSIYSYNILHEKQEEEQTPPFFSNGKEEEILKLVHMEISKQEHAEAITVYGENRVTFAVARYNQFVDRTGCIPKLKPRAFINKYVAYYGEDNNKPYPGDKPMYEESTNQWPKVSPEIQKMLESGYLDKHGRVQSVDSPNPKQKLKNLSPPEIKKISPEKIEKEITEKKQEQKPHEPPISIKQIIPEIAKERDEKSWKEFLSTLSPEELGGIQVERNTTHS